MLEEIAERFGSTTVLLGHTRGDQAETVLLGLARGSGARSLAGMRRAYGVFRRPLLDLTRDADRAGLSRAGDRVVDRPGQRATPASPGPGSGTWCCRCWRPSSARESAPPWRAPPTSCAQDVEHLDGLAVAAYDALPTPLPVDGLLALAPAIRTRVLRLAALAAGARDAELFHEHVTSLDALVTDWHGQGAVDLPGHVRGTRVDGALGFGPG